MPSIYSRIAQLMGSKPNHGRHVSYEAATSSPAESSTTFALYCRFVPFAASIRDHDFPTILCIPDFSKVLS